MIGGGLAAGTAVAAGDNEGARFVQTVASRPPDDRIPLSVAGASTPDLISRLAARRSFVRFARHSGSGSYSKSASKACPFRFDLVRSGLYAIVRTVRGVGQCGRMVGENHRERSKISGREGDQINDFDSGVDSRI